MLFKFMKKILTFFILLISTCSFAAEYKSNFNIEEFKSAQNDGKIVVIHSWNKFCTTCAKQKPILEKAKKDFQNIIFMNFNYWRDNFLIWFFQLNEKLRSESSGQ